MRISNRKKVNLFFSLSLIILLGSCKARFYTPNRNPVPLYKKAGDTYLDASVNLTNKFDATAGMSPVKGVGAYVGYAGAYQSGGSRTDSAGNTTTSSYYRGNMMNLGLGFYLPESSSPNFRFETYADLGIGNFRNKYTGQDNEFFNGNYIRRGVLCNIGYTSTDNGFNFAYSVRFSEIRFKDEEISRTSFWKNDMDRYYARYSYKMLEHALSFQFGGETTKFHLQIASYHGLDSYQVTNAIPVWNASVMIGVVHRPNIFNK